MNAMGECLRHTITSFTQDVQILLEGSDKDEIMRSMRICRVCSVALKVLGIATGLVTLSSAISFVTALQGGSAGTTLSWGLKTLFSGVVAYDSFLIGKNASNTLKLYEEIGSPERSVQGLRTFVRNIAEAARGACKEQFSGVPHVFQNTLLIRHIYTKLESLKL